MQKLEYELLSYKVPYSLQDTCVKEYLMYQQCMRTSPRIVENGIVHRLPFASVLSKCYKPKQLFTKVVPFTMC
jgi:hypothetical protein